MRNAAPAGSSPTFTIAQIQAHDDPGTVDLFSRIVQVHEKHEWWLRDILRRGDGLCA